MSDKSFYFRVLGGPLFPHSERVNNISIKLQTLGTTVLAVVFVGDAPLCAVEMEALKRWALGDN